MSASDIPLYGLILAGGKSSRMGQDKSAISYHGKPQVEEAFNLLTPFCSKVFLSNRLDQSENPAHIKFPQLHDEQTFEGKGPLGGILSAMHAYPNAAWVVLACDLPFVSDKTIKYLLGCRDASKIATAYKSSRDGLPEPLCALWESGHFNEILAYFNQGILCPRKILIKSGAQLIEPVDPKALENVNDPDEYKQAIKILGTGQ